MAEAQAALRAMLAAGTDDGLVAMDLTTLLQQDGKSAEAIAVFEKAARPDPPDYALLAATRAYRNLSRYDDAARVARQGLQRFPNDTVWPLILSLVLSDDGKAAEALAILRQPAAQRAPPVERLLAEAYAWRRAGDPFKAMRVYSEAIKAAPANPGVRLEAAGVLQDMGAPFGAEVIAGTRDAVDCRRPGGRHGALGSPGPQLRPGAPLRRHRCRPRPSRPAAGGLPPPPAEAGCGGACRLDRMVALRDRVRMREAAEEGEALSADGSAATVCRGGLRRRTALPAAAGGGARRLRAGAGAKLPRTSQARYGKFYASVELEDFKTAYATIDDLRGRRTDLAHLQRRPQPLRQSRTASAEVTAAQARFYGNQLGEAWDRITRFSDAAPANPAAGSPSTRSPTRAAGRGAPRRRPRSPPAWRRDNVGSKIALIEVAMANYRFAEAQRLMAELLALYPEDQAVRRLARELDAQRRWLFEAEVAAQQLHGGGANAVGPGADRAGPAHHAADRRQLAAVRAGDYANAHPPEGFTERARVGAGVEWRIPDLTATVSPTQSWGTFARPGGVATVDWLVTDQVRLAVSGELYTWDTPLRALLFGITADEYAAKATYRWHESRSLAASFAYMPFTDGNQRFAGGMTFKQRLINLPGFDLTGLAEGYASTQQPRANAPYYNPTRDLSLTGGLLAEHTLWRRYDNSLVQALTVDAGLYSEVRLLRQLDRHGQLRAPLALRSADRISLRRPAHAAESMTARSRTRRCSSSACAQRI